MEGKQKVALTFALYQNEALVRRETVTQDIVKVGKDAKSHLRVDDELASRMHAVIEVASPDDITLIDLGNEPGTMVNGQRVNKCKIRPGDQVQIGSTMIVLESAEAAAPSAGPPPITAASPGNIPPPEAVSSPTTSLGMGSPFSPPAARKAPAFWKQSCPATLRASSCPFGMGAPSLAETRPILPIGMSTTFTDETRKRYGLTR